MMKLGLRVQRTPMRGAAKLCSHSKLVIRLIAQV